MAEEEKVVANEETKQEVKKEGKKAIFKKWWFWVIIGVVVLAIIGVAAGGSGNGSNNGGSGNENSETVENKINDKVTVGNLEYTITSVYDTVKIGSLGDVTSNNYVVITMTIKNNGNSEITLTDSNFSYYRGNNKYEPSTQAMYLSSSLNPYLAIEKIGAGISKTITIVYEIPSAHTSTDYVQVKDGFNTAKIYVK